MFLGLKTQKKKKKWGGGGGGGEEFYFPTFFSETHTQIWGGGGGFWGVWGAPGVARGRKTIHFFL